MKIPDGRQETNMTAGLPKFSEAESMARLEELNIHGADFAFNIPEEKYLR